MSKKQILVRPVILLVSLLIINICLPFVAEAKATGDTYGYVNLGICSTTEKYVDIYEKPTEESQRVGFLPLNAGCEVLYNAGEWIYISSADVDGFVRSKYLLLGNKAWDKAVTVSEYMISGKKDKINIHKSTNADSETIYTLAKNESLSVLDDTQDQRWVKVKIADGIFGYVKSTDVDIDYTLETAVTEDEMSRRTETTK